MTEAPTKAGTAPLRIAVLGQGTRGDLYPLLGVGRTLAARGHHVEVLEFDEYGGDITAAGLRFVRVGAGSQCAEVFAGVPAGPVTARTEWVIGRLYFEASLRTAEAFGAAADRLSPRPDALVAPGHHVGAVLASELLGVPLVPVFLGPAVLQLLSDRTPVPVGVASGRERRVQSREQALIDRFVLPRMERTRRSLGMAPMRSDTSFARQPDRGGLLLTPQVLLDDHPVPAQFDVAGYPDYFGAEPTDDPPAAADLLPRGSEPLVVCSIGDGWARELPESLRGLVAGADQGRFRLVIVGGRMSGLPRSPRTLVVRSANLRRLLRQADVCVHHGGMGTVVAALRAAVPSVTVPQWPDGRRNALALARQGLGIDVGGAGRPEEVARAVDDALADQTRRDRLRRVRDAMRSEQDPASVLLRRLAQPASEGGL